ncbi:MAG: pilus assembly protein PilZ [Micavibrio aeruginosavorus]|uniref:Pilus assembly protein PilZ n=1 Tax=Micavibrio aeruginosavorus TaxID=349221 RepID=A0A2W5PVB7_9BACT|nr:MAG: pilus assembly protein PilZ [Micavibrio aeruginosavorus]
MNNLFTDVSNDINDTRRATPRRVADNCISVIDGKAYPVHNWSDGGMLVQADERLFSMAAPVEVTMKFRLSGRILDIPHRGRVIRKTRDRLAIQFEPITKEIGQKFKQVIDDYVTREFMESQMA